jgi:hypothetical protein
MDPIDNSTPESKKMKTKPIHPVAWLVDYEFKFPSGNEAWNKRKELCHTKAQAEEYKGFSFYRNVHITPLYRGKNE